jgi:hypothetical protein
MHQGRGPVPQPHRGHGAAQFCAPNRARFPSCAQGPGAQRAHGAVTQQWKSLKYEPALTEQTFEAFRRCFPRGMLPAWRAIEEYAEQSRTQRIAESQASLAWERGKAAASVTDLSPAA